MHPAPFLVQDMYPADTIHKFDPVLAEHLFTPEQVVIVQEYIEEELKKLNEQQIIYSKVYALAVKLLPAEASADEKNTLVNWNRTLLQEKLGLTHDELGLKWEHMFWLMRSHLFPAPDWLMKHPVMKESVSDPHAFFSPRRDQTPKICEGITPLNCQGVGRASRYGREWHYQYSRSSIQRAIREGKVLYAVANVEGLYGGHTFGDKRAIGERSNKPTKNTRDLISPGICEGTLSSKSWFGYLNNMPERFFVFASRADAFAYATWADHSPPVIVSIVPMRSQPILQLSNSEVHWLGSRLVAPMLPPPVLCGMMKLQDTVILGLEIFSRPWVFPSLPTIPWSNVFCETPFDAPSPRPLSSRRRNRGIWHHQFMSRLNHEPTVTDLWNWLVGYCAYYQEHKGEKGRGKAEDIRKLMQFVSQSLPHTASIEEFLNHRPTEKSPTLCELINDRRDKKTGKESWGWKHIQENFLSSGKESRSTLRCY